MRPDPTFRVSDTEREHAVQALQRHAGDGRLDMDEFAERSARAYRARTRGDLDALFTDLPEPSEPRAQVSPRRPWLAVPVAVLSALAGVGLLGAIASAAGGGMMGGMCH